MINIRSEGRINSDYGIKDYYDYYKSKSKEPKSKTLFDKVVYDFNKRIVNCIINEGLEFTPIKTQFTFCIRKHKRVIKLVDNKVVNTHPIDWKTTTQLWEDDEDARNKKVLIRFLNNHTSKYVFRILMLKGKNNYLNKRFFRYMSPRSFKRTLAKRILDPNSENYEAYKQY
jgi:hypothetical protein